MRAEPECFGQILKLDILGNTVVYFLAKSEMRRSILLSSLYAKYDAANLA